MVNLTVIKMATGEASFLVLPEETTVDVLKSLIEVDLAVPKGKQLLYFNNDHLTDDNAILTAIGIQEGSLIAVLENQDAVSIPSSSTPFNALGQAFNQHDGLARQSDLLTLRPQFDDPFNVEAQQMLEKSIHMERVSENLSLAHEYLPESFAKVSMLYVDVEVNKVHVQAFVDSGAQSTIMSKQCAARCNLVNLIDARWQGVAQGVGESKIVGKIHLADLKIGKSYYAASFIILEDNSVDFLLGLDMLRRHQCIINLDKNVLQIKDNEVSFLADADIKNPRHVC
ncbi:ubiquitin family protein [Cardiosporidium cionae]|uniref:Ubiquitin family protein n=1 Tax=Cardiosporidium cionae TaxID=476202 RepID=A0ABQ7JF79_9APIC|nr:ubiquitin family protein [Cardiosporidium cionae]|eukprot:KAF8822654.1 ubiquitin family protein [Cardiosporidium cionae]